MHNVGSESSFQIFAGSHPAKPRLVNTLDAILGIGLTFFCHNRSGGSRPKIPLEHETP